jgi:hypothetical protein
VDLQLLLTRVVRCLLLDSETYAEIRSEPTDTISGLLVVLGASYLAGLGGLIWTFTAASYVDHVRFFLRSFVIGGALQVLVFLVWVFVTSAVLASVYRVPVRYAELFRVMSFAFAPVALELIIFVPVFDQPLGIIALGAAFLVSTYAIQISTVATPGQAFVACLAGFAVFCLILGLLGNGWTDLAPGIFALDPNSLSVGSTLPVPSAFH